MRNKRKQQAIISHTERQGAKFSAMKPLEPLNKFNFPTWKFDILDKIVEKHPLYGNDLRRGREYAMEVKKKTAFGFPVVESSKTETFSVIRPWDDGIDMRKMHAHNLAIEGNKNSYQLEKRDSWDIICKAIGEEMNDIVMKNHKVDMALNNQHDCIALMQVVEELIEHELVQQESCISGPFNADTFNARSLGGQHVVEPKPDSLGTTCINNKGANRRNRIKGNRKKMHKQYVQSLPPAAKQSREDILKEQIPFPTKEQATKWLCTWLQRRGNVFCDIPRAMLNTTEYMYIPYCFMLEHWTSCFGVYIPTYKQVWDWYHHWKCRPNGDTNAPVAYNALDEYEGMKFLEDEYIVERGSAAKLIPKLPVNYPFTTFHECFTSDHPINANAFSYFLSYKHKHELPQSSTVVVQSTPTETILQVLQRCTLDVDIFKNGATNEAPVEMEGQSGEDVCGGECTLKTFEIVENGEVDSGEEDSSLIGVNNSISDEVFSDDEPSPAASIVSEDDDNESVSSQSSSSDSWSGIFDSDSSDCDVTEKCGIKFCSHSDDEADIKCD
jgi:hypothetical protein